MIRKKKQEPQDGRGEYLVRGQFWISLVNAVSVEDAAEQAARNEPEDVQVYKLGEGVKVHVTTNPRAVIL